MQRPQKQCPGEDAEDAYILVASSWEENEKFSPGRREGRLCVSWQAAASP